MDGGVRQQGDSMHLRTFVVERYLPTGADGGAGPEERLRAAAELDRRVAEETAAAGTPMRHLRTIYVPNDETCFCLFQARSVEEIELANHMAGLAFARIVEAMQTPVEAD